MATILESNNNSNNTTNMNSMPISIQQQQIQFNNGTISPPRRSPTLTSMIPPPPPSSSLKFPLEISNKSQICNLKINLDKSYFTNGETISGKINILLTERQCIKRIKLQLCGYEKIFKHEQYSTNTYQTFKFYSGNLNIPPLNINIETTSTNSLPPTGSENNSPLILSQYHYINNNNNNNNSMNGSINNNLIQEFESGIYEYPFLFQLPKFLAPSLNYLGYLSIFYLVHVKVEYSKGRDWKDQKIMKSSELWISGINKQYQDYLLLNKTNFTSFKISQYPSNIIVYNNHDKSKPIEMAICLNENNCYIGDKATFFIKLKNPLSLKFSAIRVELFQQISFVKSLTNNNDRRIKAKIQKFNSLKSSHHGSSHFDYSNLILNPNDGGISNSGGEGKTKVSQIQILLHNYDCKRLLKSSDSGSGGDGILSTSIQILIPHKIDDDQVYPTTRGFLSTVKHFFIISIPSITNFKIKVPIQLWQRFDDYNFTTTSNYISNSISSSPFNSSNGSSNFSRNSINSSNSSGSSGSNHSSRNSINSSSSSNSLNENDDHHPIMAEVQQQQQQPISLIEEEQNMIYNDDIDEFENNENEIKIKAPKDWRILWLPKWKDETTIQNCNLCDNEFTVFKRMHHCRACGGVFCESCSSQKVPLYGYGVNKKVRICLMCFDIVKAEINGGNITMLNYGINSLNINNSSSSSSQHQQQQPIFSKKKVYKPPFLVHL